MQASGTQFVIIYFESSFYLVDVSRAIHTKLYLDSGRYFCVGDDDVIRLGRTGFDLLVQRVLLAEPPAEGNNSFDNPATGQREEWITVRPPRYSLRPSEDEQKALAEIKMLGTGPGKAGSGKLGSSVREETKSTTAKKEELRFLEHDYLPFVVGRQRGPRQDGAHFWQV